MSSVAGFWGWKPRRNHTATALNLAGVTVKIEESALHDSQNNGLERKL